MGMLGLIGGHSILGSEPDPSFERTDVSTSLGDVSLHVSGSAAILQRHGIKRYTTAARVDHARNLSALTELGCDRILALGSVGSLDRGLGIGTFVCPDDFIALHLGLSLGDGHLGERVPGFDPEFRARVVESWPASAGELVDGGVYWQAIGPRFETPAEIRLIAAHADVIGMTIASECVISGEMGIPYAAICIVDNFANGIGDQPLTVDEFELGKAANRARLLAALDALVQALTEEE